MPRTARTTPRLLPRFMGGSTLFNGTSSVIACGVLPSITASQQEITISFWAKLHPANKTVDAIILGNAGNNTTVGFCVRKYTDQKIIVYHGGTSASFIPKYDTWNFYTVIIKRAISIEIFENGVLKGSRYTGVSDYSLVNGSTPFRIGATGTQWFRGLISEVYLVPRSVTEAERYAIMNGSFPSDATNLWKLDDQPSTYLDTIGGANGTGTDTTYSQDVPVQQRVAMDEDAKASLSMDGNADYITLTTPITPGTITFETKMRSTLFRTYFFNSSLNRTIQTTASGFWQTYDGGDRISNFLARANVWDKMAFVYDGTGYKIYRNGQFVSKISPSEQIAIEIISRTSSDAVSGNLKNVRMWSQATQLTHQQIRDLHFNNIVPTTGLVLNLKLNEGAGTVAYDSSGNGNHGTITGATWSADVPSKKKTFVGDNLVKNGDFAYQPPFVAETTGNGRVVDGSAAGASAGADNYLSEARKLFRWKTNIYVATGGKIRYAIEDGRKCMKFEGTLIKERVHVHLGFRNYTDLNTTTDIAASLIKLKPSTVYRLSYYSKAVISNVVGTLNDGVSLRIYPHSSTAHLRSIIVSVNKVSTDWTKYEYELTTSASERFLNISFGIFGDSSNYCDAIAYFSDISLTEVVAARTVHP